MFAAKRSAKVRKKTGISKKVADEWTAADMERGYKTLPEYVGKKKGKR